jgi:hypothetical protein
MWIFVTLLEGTSTLGDSTRINLNDVLLKCTKIQIYLCQNEKSFKFFIYYHNGVFKL